MKNYPITITVDKVVHHFEMGEYLHNEEDKCKFRRFENGTSVANFESVGGYFHRLCGKF